LKKAFVFSFIAVFIVGACLRFLFPSDVPFAADEAFALMLGGDWLASPRLVLHGMPSSVGLANPPASVYLFAAVFSLSGGNPELGSQVVMGWNVLGLALAAAWFYGVARKVGSFWAWWGLAFLCLNPWAVLLSRKIWAQDLLLSFVVVAVWGISGIWNGKPEESGRWTGWQWTRIAVGVGCALLVSQIHMSGVFWLAAMVFGGVIFWPCLQRKQIVLLLLLSIGLALVLYAPWFVYFLRNDTFSDDMLGRVSLWKRLHDAVSMQWVLLGQGRSLRYFFAPGEETNQFLTYMGKIWGAGQYVLIGVLGGAFFAALMQGIRALRGQTARDILPVLCIALVLFPLLMVVGGIRIHLHYAAVCLFPAAVVLASGFGAVEQYFSTSEFCSESSAKRRKLSKLPYFKDSVCFLVRAMACCVLLLQLWSTLGFLFYIHTAGGSKGDHGPCLRVTRETVSEMLSQGRKQLSDDAPLEYRYLLDYAQGLPTRLDKHPAPY
jgi:hypothetical protein